jgi:transcriptional antiterminator RfaH
MFPGYLFTKFVYSKQHRAVEASHGVRGIVRFGDRLATLPENIVAGLQSRVGAEEVVTIDSSIKIGQAVEIIEGPFRGLEVLVTPCERTGSGPVRVSWAIRRNGISTAKVLTA